MCSRASPGCRFGAEPGDAGALDGCDGGAEGDKRPPKPACNQKPKSSPGDPRGPAPAGAEGLGEPSGASANGAVSPPRVPGKRGRKSKAEMLLLKLSQDLDCPSPDPLCVQKVLGSSEAAGGLEDPPRGRPKRRAAKV